MMILEQFIVVVTQLEIRSTEEIEEFWHLEATFSYSIPKSLNAKIPELLFF
jgi:hypothetical protein